MDPKLAIGLATFMSGVATSLAAAPHGFHDIFTPGFVASLMLQLSGFILAVWGGINTKPPRDPETRTRANDTEPVIPPAIKATSDTTATTPGGPKP